jgi:hypothetical protein
MKIASSRQRRDWTIARRPGGSATVAGAGPVSAVGDRIGGEADDGDDGGDDGGAEGSVRSEGPPLGIDDVARLGPHGPVHGGESAVNGGEVSGPDGRFHGDDAPQIRRFG